LTLEDRTFLKFKLLTREVEKRLSYKLSIVSNKAQEELDYSDISPLKIIFPAYMESEYLRHLVTKVHTIFPKDNPEYWASQCEGSISFLDVQKRMELASLYIQLHTVRRSNFVSFIFYSLIGVTVYKENYDENLSFIIDFARVFGLSKDEILDITEVSKAFFGNSQKDFSFKTKEVGQLFSSVYSYLTAN